MSPKKSSARKGAVRKPSAKKTPRAPSPMRKIEHSVGKNVNGLSDQARAAHALPPEVPARTPARTSRSAPTAPPNQPPAPPASSTVDEGQKE